VGSIGVATATKGRLSLGTFVSNGVLPTLPTSTVLAAPPPEYAAHYAALGALGAWQNLTMSPSFAAGGHVLLGMLHAATALNANGLIGVDPVAPADLLAVTGPVGVPGFPVPLTSAKRREPGAQSVVRRVPRRLRPPRRPLRRGAAHLPEGHCGRRRPPCSGRRARQGVGRQPPGHLLDQPVARGPDNQVGIGRDLSPTTGDNLLVVGQNQDENKMDYYAKRQISGRRPLPAHAAEPGHGEPGPFPGEDRPARP
jgi:hypothetical protein